MLMLDFSKLFLLITLEQDTSFPVLWLVKKMLLLNRKTDLGYYNVQKIMS